MTSGVVICGDRLYFGTEDGSVYCADKNTGEEIERGLLEAARRHPNIEIRERQFAIDIITQHHLGQRVTKHTPNIECYGVYALDCDTNRIDTYLARVTLLATGGMGNVYSTTTTPVIWMAQ